MIEYCPCGSPVDAAPFFHKRTVEHDCPHHIALFPQCKTCAMVGAIEFRLRVEVEYGPFVVA